MPNRTENKNNTWYNYTDSNTAIVFVHGFLSDSEKCWTATNGRYWPRLVMEDSLFNSSAIFLGGYHTAIDSGRYELTQCALELLDGLKRRQNNKRAPIDYPNLVFICHSLGGILCRRLLEEYKTLFANKKVGLLLVASPSMGSEYANYFSSLSRLYGNRLAQQLKVDGELIQDIDNRFRNLIDRKEIKDLVGAEICEQHGPIRHKWLPIRMKPVVSKDSASRYFGQLRIIADTDHESIAKPTSPTHKSHTFLQTFFQENFCDRTFIQPSLTNQRPLGSINIDPDPLFDVYSPVHRSYYLTRDIDEHIKRGIETTTIWMHGCSGGGKTSLAKRAIDALGCSTREIHLGHLDSSCTPDQILSEIIYTLDPNATEANNNLHRRAVQLIRAQSNYTIVPIFFDEVPISEGLGSRTVLTTIANLLEASKSELDLKIRFLICSIRPPAQELITAKMREHIKFVEVAPWTIEELQKLYDLISAVLKQDPEVIALRSHVSRLAKGSPRFLKIFFRNLASEESIGISTEGAIQRALNEVQH